MDREAALSPGAAETRAELRARLSEAERLVRRLRADAERQRREVLAAAAGGAVTNLLFDGAAARHAHVCHATFASYSCGGPQSTSLLDLVPSFSGTWWTDCVIFSLFCNNIFDL